MKWKARRINLGNLLKKLEEYYNKDYLPMHMPGHKRNVKLLGEKLPYKIDITEISGFDDLHHANGLIKNIENSIFFFLSLLYLSRAKSSHDNSHITKINGVSLKIAVMIGVNSFLFFV